MIQVFSFNPLKTNTYIVYDQQGECLIVDPAFQYPEEFSRLLDFFAQHRLIPRKIVNTHSHIDHILGNHMLKNHFKIPLLADEAGNVFLQTARESAAMLNLSLSGVVYPDRSLKDGDIVEVGALRLKVISTPGHAVGSVSLYNEKEKYLLSRDVLFRESIGRTDLPTGDFDVLNQVIKDKLFVLPNEVVVYPGHGPETSIGHEKLNNPFLHYE
jgi:glyoxylase-like metal-dependent hydrolase (beta-lactamase superfamily II)